MHAFSASLKTVLLSLLFATLLVLTAGSTASSGEDVTEQDVEQKNAITPEEFVASDFSEQTNFWPPVHLRGLRSSNGKPTFIRFGKRASPSFIRFGRK
ncbi:unnamed protein product [Caenorhabditis sp. 36 PRJEB53466]|nr:unnamed protein product [Caenorhabditis sp. 36 PRJEB53466]